MTHKFKKFGFPVSTYYYCTKCGMLATNKGGNYIICMSEDIRADQITCKEWIIREIIK